jgi:Transcriptional regulatory protein, C terminal
VSESVGLWIQVLGPMEVSADGCVAPLRGVRQRRLLAALVATPNRVVSSDRLVDMVWGDAPPEGASTVVDRCRDGAPGGAVRPDLHAGQDGEISEGSHRDDADVVRVDVVLLTDHGAVPLTGSRLCPFAPKHAR